MSEINKSQLKTYAAGARLDFIQAVKEKAAKFGIFADHIVQAKESGNLLIIDHLTYPHALITAYHKVLDMVENLGFEETINEIAYTWFNRMIALRYMELHHLLPHGYKVIGDDRPEILVHADHVTMDSLDTKKVTDMLLAGDKDEELYQYLLYAQLSELNKTLPFLFEKIDDAATLLMPDNLLASDSIRSKMVKLDSENFEQIEVVGWLYQFYISEVKDKLMEAGKAYKKEEIPAVTQLFTPNWIVKYMIQNSLGSKWLETYPNSPLKSKMEYYIEPAEQTPEVQAELNKLKDDRINPEELKILDPACGSGHILVEAYDLLKEIYTEKGYSRREIPELIIKNNLYGIDLDKRAAQLAYFALAMKACNDNPRLLEHEMHLNIICIEESNKINTINASRDLVDGTKLSVGHQMVEDLLDNFTDAKTYGSLIKIKPEIMENIDLLSTLVEEGVLSHNIFRQRAANDVKHFVKMAQFLGQKYDIVVANPPYMGIRKQNNLLKEFAQHQYPETKSDLFSMFIEHGFYFTKKHGYNAMVTMQSWMFLSSFEQMRRDLLNQKTLLTMAHLGARAFREISGEVVQTTSFVFKNFPLPAYKGCFLRLVDGDDTEKENNLRKRINLYNHTSQRDFLQISSCPIAYWISSRTRRVFASQKFSDIAEVKSGVLTGNDELFSRLWFEVPLNKTVISAVNYEDMKTQNKTWIRITGGGTVRKWYGSLIKVVNLRNEGADIKALKNNNYRLRDPKYYYREGINWKLINSSECAFIYSPANAVFGNSVRTAFVSDTLYYLSLFNSKIIKSIISCLNPTTNLNNENVEDFPIINTQIDPNLTKKLIMISKKDWNSYETSWDFDKLPMLSEYKKGTVASSYKAWREQSKIDIAETKHLEEENNRVFIEAYGLQDELTPDVPLEQITLTVNPRYRYKSDASDAELEERFKADTIKELISYAIGCMMGRYSLNQDGLVYANEKNEGFDTSKYQTIPADDDAIIPVTDFAWFPEEDLANRISDFVEKVWGKETLEENLLFIAEALDKKSTETSMDAIRRYVTKDLYKNHLQMYKNRPIYWLFSSGKEKAFECLVYMHRMNERTLARIRMQFIVPLLSKYDAALVNLDNSINSASSIAERKNLEKQKDKMEKQYQELRDYDDHINHAINARIDFDLDDGVSVNYAKFGKLLAESKKIVGK